MVGKQTTAGLWTLLASKWRVKVRRVPTRTPFTHASMCCRAKGGSERSIRRKIHILMGEKTLELRTIEATCSSISDAPVLPDLLNQIHLTRRSEVSQRTVHTVNSNATMLLRLAMHMRSFTGVPPVLGLIDP
jgi:hypothetical protein